MWFCSDFFSWKCCACCSVFLSFLNDEMQMFWRLFWTLKIENKSSYHRVWCGELLCLATVSDPCGAKNCGVDIETWTTGSLHSQWGSCFLIPWNLRLKVRLNLLQHLSIRKSLKAFVCFSGPWRHSAGASRDRRPWDRIQLSRLWFVVVSKTSFSSVLCLQD